ncbi:MAG TPA: carboxypeptidase-like regulatory domain-containing protein, partial [Haliscomenobacter sp.]|nr:carboxypeptidase-like regulatory domain-containing protein [Haliscomenobacter sp.]
MKRYSLLVALLLCYGAILAQNIVKGRVSDDKGEPLVGVNITIKGSTQGAFTDGEGLFSIPATPDAVLVASYIGFETVEIPVGNQSNIEITLSGAEVLDEVVVVGFGTQKKATLTGSVNQFKTEELTRRQVPSVSQLLQGIAPGVSVWQSSGKPGADGANIRIRGTG